MLIAPRKAKFRKAFKGVNKGKTKSCFDLTFGQYGIQVLENINLKANTFEAAVKIINKRIKSVGRVWLRTFPDKPVSKKPNETRMGKGKGSVDHHVCVIKPGRIFIEFDGVNFDEAKKIFQESSNKIGAHCRLVRRNFGDIEMG